MLHKVRRLFTMAAAALAGVAVVQEMRKPESERDWHGEVFGVVPYDFRRPTIGRIKERLWNPDDPRLFTPHVFGVGWTLNLYRLWQILNTRAKSNGDG